MNVMCVANNNNYYAFNFILRLPNLSACNTESLRIGPGNEAKLWQCKLLEEHNEMSKIILLY